MFPWSYTSIVVQDFDSRGPPEIEDQERFD